MTNSEAIKLLSQEKIPMTLDGKLNEPLVIAHIKAISVLEENDKLKAEAEQFSNELISVLIENELLKKKNELTNYYYEQYSAAIDEIEQLKSELEQSAKFPLTNADKIRSMDDEELAEFLSETHDEEIGKFLGDIATCDNNIKSIFEWLQSEVLE